MEENGAGQVRELLERGWGYGGGGVLLLLLFLLLGSRRHRRRRRRRALLGQPRPQGGMQCFGFARKGEIRLVERRVVGSHGVAGQEKVVEQGDGRGRVHGVGGGHGLAWVCCCLCV